MDKGMVKIRNMLEVDDEAAVCLEKTVFGQQIQPVLHIVDGFKIAQCGMDDDFSPQGFYRYDGGRQKRVYALLCFHRNLDGDGVVQIQGVFQIAEKAPDIQRFGQVAEYLKTHGIVQIFGIRGHNKNDNILISPFQLVSHINAVDARHFDIKEEDVYFLLVRKQALPVGKAGYFRAFRTDFLEIDSYIFLKLLQHQGIIIADCYAHGDNPAFLFGRRLKFFVYRKIIQEPQ